MKRSMNQLALAQYCLIDFIVVPGINQHLDSFPRREVRAASLQRL